MRHSLDAVVVRDQRIFAYGWVYDPQRLIHELALHIVYADGSSAQVPVTVGKERLDVAAAFPTEPMARWSGWIVYAGWDRPASRIDLIGVFEDGESFTLPVQGSLGRKQRVRELVRSVLSRAQAAPASTARDDRDAVGTLRAALQAAGLLRLCLVLDHTMGGGANRFRGDWVKARLADDLPMLAVLSFEVHSLAWALELHMNTGQVLRLPCSPDLPRRLAQAEIVGEIFVNDVVSFPHPDQVPQWLRAWADKGAEITVASHDYLAVCPSPFLINYGGRYCGVPEIDECRRCIQSNPNTFPSVQPGPDMDAWRQAWGEALGLSRQVLCFSNSSRQLLLRAYPALDEAKITVVPHQVPSFPRGAHVSTGGPLHVGVVGAIGQHKGAAVLQGLAAEGARCGADLHITVFGTLDGMINDTVVTVTGPYQRDDLPDLIESSGVNVFLLPSICPETFSYVTHELIELGVPLACFDLGAPADRVRNYPLGRVLPLGDARQLLGDLTSFHHDLQMSNLKEIL